jgi:hypothetical protein
MNLNTIALPCKTKKARHKALQRKTKREHVFRGSSTDAVVPKQIAF